MARLPRATPGEPIRAEHYNAFMELAAQLGVAVGGGGGLSLSDGAVSRAGNRGRWIKLTLSLGSGNYAWTQVVRISGSWHSTPYTGGPSDPAVEANGNATVTVNSYARAWRAEDGKLMFQAGTC